MGTSPPSSYKRTVAPKSCALWMPLTNCHWPDTRQPSPLRSARPTAAVELAMMIDGSAINSGQRSLKPGPIRPNVSMPIIRFQPALPSARETASMTRICVIGSASAPWMSGVPASR